MCLDLWELKLRVVGVHVVDLLAGGRAKHLRSGWRPTYNVRVAVAVARVRFRVAVARVWVRWGSRRSSNDI